MNRLTSAKIYVDQIDATRSDRFNEAVAPSMKSGKSNLSQSNLMPFKKNGEN